MRRIEIQIALEGEMVMTIGNGLIAAIGAIQRTTGDGKLMSAAIARSIAVEMTDLEKRRHDVTKTMTIRRKQIVDGGTEVPQVTQDIGHEGMTTVEGTRIGVQRTRTGVDMVMTTTIEKDREKTVPIEVMKGIRIGVVGREAQIL
jgi:hypothetical protein